MVAGFAAQMKGEFTTIFNNRDLPHKPALPKLRAIL